MLTYTYADVPCVQGGVLDRYVQDAPVNMTMYHDRHVPAVFPDFREVQAVSGMTIRILVDVYRATGRF